LEEKKMKKIRSIVCLFLALLMLGSLCACGSNDSSGSKSESVEDKVRRAVTTSAWLEHNWFSIGGNELKSSSATISTVKKVTETEYKVSGKMSMIDIYGTKWSNNFDCKVTTSDGEEWSAKSFEYTSNNWSKN
jgi:hypothetical protein